MRPSGIIDNDDVNVMKTVERKFSPTKNSATTTQAQRPTSDCSTNLGHLSTLLRGSFGHVGSSSGLPAACPSQRRCESGGSTATLIFEDHTKIVIVSFTKAKQQQANINQIPLLAMCVCYLDELVRCQWVEHAPLWVWAKRK